MSDPAEKAGYLIEVASRAPLPAGLLAGLRGDARAEGAELAVVDSAAGRPTGRIRSEDAELGRVGSTRPRPHHPVRIPRNRDPREAGWVLPAARRPFRR